MRTVAVLCAAKKTAYRDIPGVEVYDEARDARTFCCGMPVIAHPPCRRWTQFGANMLKAAAVHGNRIPSDGEIKCERQLGIWCADRVRECGGILEQPAKSKLFHAAGLPIPGQRSSDKSFSLEVWQQWWGYPIRKCTWLFFQGIAKNDIHIPLQLSMKQRAGREWDYKLSHSSGRRSETVPALANWLVDLARTANIETNT